MAKLTLDLAGRHDRFSRHHIPCTRPASEYSRSAKEAVRQKAMDFFVVAFEG